MRTRTVGLALLAGLATFVVVGVAVTELAAPRVAFSLFVGLPVGVIAGLAAAALVLARLGAADWRRRRPALALAGFGLEFVTTAVVAVGGLGLRNSVAVPVAALAGSLVAAGTAGWDALARSGP